MRTVEEIAKELFDCNEQLKLLEMLNTPVEYEDRYKAFLEKALATKRAENLTEELDEAMKCLGT
jgi:hypothetical protein